MKLSEKDRNILLSILFIITVSFVFMCLPLIKIPNNHKCNNFIKKPISEINKIVIVGDSRMSLIYDAKDQHNIPKNVIFIAINGATIDWLYEEAIKDLKETISNTKYNYHVVFNLGVNDLSYYEYDDVDVIAKEYFNTYEKIINRNRNVFFYMLSVNPIDDEIIGKYFKKNMRTNKKIEKFNNYFIKNIDSKKIQNFKYCDSYNSLDFDLYDGLHFTFDTDQIIIDYIINNCVEFK